MSRWLAKPPPFLSLDRLSMGIPLTQGKIAWIDVSDFPLVKDFTWCAQRPRRTHLTSYAIRRRPASQSGAYIIRMHNWITGWPLVDHVDGDGLNNRRSNLRQATSQQNSANAQPHSRRSSIYKGLRQERNGHWTARVQRRHIGTFATQEQAARAYDVEALRVFGEFARLNFPEGS